MLFINAKKILSLYDIRLFALFILLLLLVINSFIGIKINLNCAKKVKIMFSFYETRY